MTTNEQTAKKNARRRVLHIPDCRGHRYHVFCVGDARCSVCGWNRFEALARTTEDAS